MRVKQDVYIARAEMREWFSDLDLLEKHTRFGLPNLNLAFNDAWNMAMCEAKKACWRYVKAVEEYVKAVEDLGK